MMIILRPFSVFQNYFEGSRIEIKCSPGTTYSQLCEIIDARWGSGFPKELWDSKAKRFTDNVIVMIGSKDVNLEEDPVLSNGQEVLLLLPFAGG